MLLVGKFIGRFKKGVFDIALLSRVNDNDFNKMSLFYVRIFSVQKETYLIKICNSSHHCPGIIRENASLDRHNKGVSYGLDDAIHNDSECEYMKKQSHHHILKWSIRMNNISIKRDKIRVIKSPIIYFCMIGKGTIRITSNGFFKIME